MSLPDITKELEKVLDHFEPIAKEAFPESDRGETFSTTESFARSWLFAELAKAMKEFRLQRNK